MRKTDNDFMLARLVSEPTETQISLDLGIEQKESEYWKKWRSPQQEAAFQNLLSHLRQENIAMVAIANEMYSTAYKDGKEIPNDRVAPVRAKYQENPLPYRNMYFEMEYAPWKGKVTPQEFCDLGLSMLAHPDIYGSTNSALFKLWEEKGLDGLRERLGNVPPQVGKKEREYRPWGKKRLWGNRVRKLIDRTRKRWHLPDLYIDALQEEVLKNPEYFGVCLLDGKKESPVGRHGDDRLAAIEREQELREQND